MSLRSAAETVRSRPGGTCSVSLFLNALTTPQQEEFNELLPELSGAEMARAIEAEYKIRLSGGAILRHRRGECTCDAR